MFRLIAVACLASQAIAITIEVYYGPYCPNSANYLSMYLQPFLEANIPGAQFTVLPYAIDPAIGTMPTPCPSPFPGSPCGVLAAPMCALQPFASMMPMALTPEYKAAINFAICDLIHANHGAPAMLTHTPADIQKCAADNHFASAASTNCMAAPTPMPAYVEKLMAGHSRLPGGKIAPFVFIDGTYTENNVPLITAVCNKLGRIPQCVAAQALGAFETGRPVLEGRTVPLLLGFLGCAAAAAAAAFAATRVRASWRRELGEAPLVSEE